MSCPSRRPSDRSHWCTTFRKHWCASKVPDVFMALLASRIRSEMRKSYAERFIYSRLHRYGRVLHVKINVTHVLAVAPMTFVYNFTFYILSVSVRTAAGAPLREENWSRIMEMKVKHATGFHSGILSQSMDWKARTQKNHQLFSDSSAWVWLFFKCSFCPWLSFP